MVGSGVGSGAGLAYLAVWGASTVQTGRTVSVTLPLPIFHLQVTEASSLHHCYTPDLSSVVFLSLREQIWQPTLNAAIARVRVHPTRSTMLSTALKCDPPGAYCSSVIILVDPSYAEGRPKSDGRAHCWE